MIDGDVVVTEQGDILLAHSVKQAIRVRLLWFFSEWRFNTEFGIPYYEEILIKNPNIPKAKLLISQAIRDVEEVVDVEDIQISIDSTNRTALVSFVVYTTKESFRMEVELGG